MSFSNRASRWANSAVVVSVGAEYGDLGPEGDLRDCVGGGDPLAGLRFQEEMEARAAEMGGGDLECPVQRVPDFLEGKLSTEPLPRSSYRLGVRPAPLHELYPPAVTEALREALRRWGRTMPGFASEDALLHGVETRTSAPVQRAARGRDLRGARAPRTACTPPARAQATPAASSRPPSTASASAGATHRRGSRRYGRWRGTLPRGVGVGGKGFITLYLSPW